MPRFMRVEAPGALVHVISRFVNRAHRLAGAADRAVVLDAVPSALARSDWRLLAFALMSSHVHLVLRAGDEPTWRFLKSFQTRVARRLNQRQRAFGPVFAERATTIAMAPERAPALLAYVHNNPVRAEVVCDPAASRWTSHRAYVGLDTRPAWLDAPLGLRLAGLRDEDAGRAAFHALVVARASSGRDATMSGPALCRLRAQARAETGLPAEIVSPTDLQGTGQLQAEVLLPACGAHLRSRWNGDLGDLLRQVSVHRNVSLDELCSRSQRRTVTAARRLVVITGHLYLGRRMNELSTALGLSASTASRLLVSDDRQRAEAREMAAAVREGRPYGHGVVAA